VKADAAPAAPIDSFRFSRGERTAALVGIPLFAFMSGAGLKFWLHPAETRDARVGPLLFAGGLFFVGFFVLRLARWRRTRFDLFDDSFRWQHGGRVVESPFTAITTFRWHVTVAYVRSVPAKQHRVSIGLRDGRRISLDESIERVAELGSTLEGLLKPYGVANQGKV